jgi:HEAT repeat protein
MIKSKVHPRVSRGRKKNRTPLSKLRTSEVVKTVVDNPRRLEELFRLLEESDRAVRGRAAATIARLVESYPGRLVRSVERLKQALNDDSAYVRWHLAYTLGLFGSCYPNQIERFLPELVGSLDDDNRVVRHLASQAVGQLAAKKPEFIQKFFETNKRSLPLSVGRRLDKKH